MELKEQGKSEESGMYTKSLEYNFGLILFFTFGCFFYVRENPVVLIFGTYVKFSESS